MKDKRLNFQSELTTALVFVSVIPLILCGIILVHTFKTKIERDNAANANLKLSEISESISTLLCEIEYVTLKITENKTIRDYLYVGEIEQRKYPYLELTSITGDTKNYVTFSLYSDGGVCQYSTDFSNIGDKQSITFGPFAKSKRNPSEMITRSVLSYDGKKEDCLRAIRPIFREDGKQIGFITADIYPSGFSKLIHDSFSQNDIYLFDEKWHNFYASNAQNDAVPASLRTAVEDGKSFEDIGFEDQYYVESILDGRFYAVLELHSIFTATTMKTLYRISLFFILLGLFLSGLVAFLFSRYFTQPIKIMSDAMKEVENGDFDVEINVNRRDEFADLSESFNRMTGELKQSVERQIKNQEEIDDANIAAMQAQLNPHFLYNTLDTIKWMAKSHDVQDIATLSSSLARILRTSISGEKILSLKEEIDFARSYIKIQQLRFSGQFEYVENIDPSLLCMKVPKLMLQPLIENSIVHGLEGRADGWIRISIQSLEGALSITVEDNGSGMDDEMIHAINHRDKEALEGHLGVYNVDTIIRLRYGEEYGLHVRNLEHGVLVTIRLPFER